MRPSSTRQTKWAASLELEGSKIKELEDNKRLQGDYFDNMEVSDQPVPLIYMDMDGVMITEIMRSEWKVRWQWYGQIGNW
jgi:hypothetical protein